jgi:ADP-ribose pyrophosphatase
MPLKPWKRLSGREIHRNPWWTYMLDAYELPSGRRGEYHYVFTHGSSMVVPVMPDGNVLLVNQYRYLVGRESLEFPCGGVKEGSTHDRTAGEELAEETGYAAGRLLLAGRFNPYNGVTNEMCNVYVARDLRHVGGEPDDTEEFELQPLSAAEVDERIRSGAIWDGMTIAGWAIVKTLVG